MDFKYILDYALKAMSGKEGDYKTKNGELYDRYMTNDDWNNYVMDMETNYEQAYNEYDDGYGKELKEKQYPPKMACFGSSSKFIYELARDIDGFHFEKLFPTKIGGGISNLDGYIERQNLTVCVEAKSREIYGKSHKGEKRSKVYKNLLKAISNTKELDLTFELCDCEEKISIVSYYKGKIIEHFDIMQLICHYCGIANQIKEGKIKNKVRFVYLIYNPDMIEEKYFPEEQYVNKSIYKKGIVKRYESTLEMINEQDMNKLFDVVFSYCSEGKEISYDFEFKVADQTNFLENLN